MSTKREDTKIIKLSGKRTDYYTWSRLFSSYANLKQYNDVLSGDAKIPSQVEIDAESDGEKKKLLEKIISSNKKAKAELFAAMQNDPTCFDIVESAVDAYQAFKDLREKYEP